MMPEMRFKLTVLATSYRLMTCSVIPAFWQLAEERGWSEIHRCASVKARGLIGAVNSQGGVTNVSVT